MHENKRNRERTTKDIKCNFVKTCYEVGESSEKVVNRENVKIQKSGIAFSEIKGEGTSAKINEAKANNQNQI